MNDAPTEHHEKLDELINNSRKPLHDLLNQAWNSGALTTEFKDGENYLLSKAVFTIYGENAYVPTKAHKKDVENLRHFI